MESIEKAINNALNNNNSINNLYLNDDNKSIANYNDEYGNNNLSDNDTINDSSFESGINDDTLSLKSNNLALTTTRRQNSMRQSTSQKLLINKKRDINLNKILKLNGNDKCADCLQINSTWISINLGICLCIECSGKHRGLGVHISKIRSLILDDLDNETQSVLLLLGNNLINKIYESNLSSIEFIRPNESSDNGTRENWIRMKYLHKAFVRPILNRIYIRNELDLNIDYLLALDNSNNDLNINDNRYFAIIDTPNDLLYLASTYANLSLIIYSLALNADINLKDDKNNGETPLIKAVKSGSIETVELLILNGAKLCSTDYNGQTPLHYATHAKNLK